MAAPTTPFEDNGGTEWTTIAEETAFLQQIAAQTDAAYSVAGTSVEGNLINRVDLGNPSGQTMLIVTGQHGIEVAPREGVLRWVRDVAYSTDPAVTGYLAQNRVVVLTPANPDRLGVSYRNANGQDINQSSLTLEAPEAQVIAAVRNDVQAQVFVDVHGRDDLNGPYEWTGMGTGLAAAHEDVRAVAADLLAEVRDALTTAGYSNAPHPANDLNRRSLTNTSGLRHAVALLSETWSGPIFERSTIVTLVLNTVLRFHAANAWRIGAARSASVAAAESNARYVFPLQTGAKVSTLVTVPLDPAPATYTVTGGELPEEVLVGHEIQLGGATVSMEQGSSYVVPFLLDPAADDVLVTAVATPKAVPQPPTQARVRINGATHDVVQLRHRADGVTRDVTLSALGL